ARLRLYWTRELLALGFVVEPRIMKLGERLGRRYLEKNVADRALRDKLTPRYTMGCKRVLPTNDYLPALQRSNVELVTEGIAEVRARSIVSKDGTERAVDALVLATGFEAAEQVSPFPVRGSGGRDLDDAWRDGAEAYLGTSVAGFPNLFLLVGPNTGLGHNSMVFMIESQLSYVLDAVKKMRANGWRSVEVRPEAQARYNARIQERLKDTVWASGCMSWYLTSTGKNTTLWPGFTFEFRRLTRRFDERAYSATPGTRAQDGASVAQAPASTTSSLSFTLT
ncbi:MAG TPA: NAD(P)/FAD-dependent oxidoreductase, partial [Polyangiaceae bacterium]